MAITSLTEIENFSFPTVDEPKEKYYKIYNDGGHYVGTLFYRSGFRHSTGYSEREDKNVYFDSLYDTATQLGYVRSERTDFIRTGLLKNFTDCDIDEYISDRIKKKLHNLYVRKKRFRRKAFLNKWNYFVTITYDDEKQTEESFRKKLRKCLSNLHTRRGWKYMGVFERAPETNRLHFHALVYVPVGEMLGRITELRDYSTAQGKMQITHSNSFFGNFFGRNDFEEITESELRHGNALNYILKYIEKTGERIVYGRGIPTAIVKKVSDGNVITDYIDYVRKFIFFDNVISQDDISRNFKVKQITITDLLCNPPQSA